MNVQILRSAAKIALPVFVVALAVPAFAVDVTFSTYGTFSGTPSTAGVTATYSDTNVGANLLATPLPSNDTVALADANNNSTVKIVSTGVNNEFVSLGPPVDTLPVIQFQLSEGAGGTGTGQVPLAGETFTLNIVQSAVPGGPGSGALSGSLEGTVGINGPAGVPNISFSTTSLTLGSVTYTLDSPQFTFSTPGGGGALVASGFLNIDVAPEPTFYGLTGFGFAGLLAMALRRKRQIAA